MPRMEVKGLDDLIKSTEALAKNPAGYVKRALWVGAGMTADAIKAAVASLPVASEPGNKKHPMRGVTSVEKAGLVTGVGISRMYETGQTVEVVIGFNGENADGDKNTTTMRRIESGTSIRRKIPTIRPAVNRTRAKAFSAMQEQFARDLQEQFGTGT